MIRRNTSYKFWSRQSILLLARWLSLSLLGWLLYAACRAWVALIYLGLPWFDLPHKKLDEAVLAAYDWPADLTDEQILERLLALNLERARML